MDAGNMGRCRETRIGTVSYMYPPHIWPWLRSGIPAYMQSCSGAGFTFTRHFTHRYYDGVQAFICVIRTQELRNMILRGSIVHEHSALGHNSSGALCSRAQ